MEEKKGASPAMPDAFEAGDRPTASEIQRQLIEQLQNTLVAARDANRATAAAREASAPRAGNLLLSAPLPTLEGRRYEPQGPDDPNDPENRALNPGTGVGAYAALLSRPQKEQLPPEQAIPQLFERM